MPKRKSPEEIELAEATSSVRSQLASCREVLLQFMRKHKIDRIPIPNERVIICKQLVSAKRITQQVVLDAVKATVEENKGSRIPDSVGLFCAFKSQLQQTVDKITYSSDVVCAASKDANKKPRDGPAPVDGSPDLLTQDIIDIANEVWCLKEASSTIAGQRKAARLAKAELCAAPVCSPAEECVREPNSPPTCEDPDVELESPDPPDCSPVAIMSEPVCEDTDTKLGPPDQEGTSAASTSTDSEPPLPEGKASPMDTIPQTTVEPKPVKSKNSVSKKLCYILIERIADHIFTSSRKSRMPSWAKLENDISWLIQQFFIDPK